MKHGNEDLPSHKLDLSDTSIRNVLRQRRRFLLGHLKWPSLPVSIVLILLITLLLIPVFLIDWMKRKNRANPLFGTILILLIAPIIVIMINMFLYRTYQVVGSSMTPTLQNNDRLLIDKTSRTWSKITGHAYVPHRGDIIIFDQTATFTYAGPTKEELVKRVIGLPGERVVVKDGLITVFNSANPQGINPDLEGNYKVEAFSTPVPINVTLKSDEIFVCGDNRNNSLDSRATEIGPVKLEKIIGKLDARFYPFEKAKGF